MSYTHKLTYRFSKVTILSVVHRLTTQRNKKKQKYFPNIPMHDAVQLICGFNAGVDRIISLCNETYVVIDVTMFAQ